MGRRYNAFMDRVERYSDEFTILGGCVAVEALGCVSAMCFDDLHTRTVHIPDFFNVVGGLAMVIAAVPGLNSLERIQLNDRY